MTDNQKLAIIRGAKVKLEMIADTLAEENINTQGLTQELTSVRDQLTYLINEL